VPDLIIRGGTLVDASGRRDADLVIEDGRIVDITLEPPAGAGEIDARGLHVLPGLIDVHLHFNEPGRTEWEGAATGSRALAAGGGTLFFDMPLNSSPCTITPDDFDRKRAALEAASIADFGLWGGLVPGHVGDMAEMAARGVVGFKAFMCGSGLPEFPRADDATLLDGLREAARLGLPVAVHAENDELTAAPRGRGARDFLLSRPVVAEVEAIQRAVLLAGEARAKLHIVHVSSGRGVVMAAEARARGVDVSIETCPHYLYFTDEDVERLGVAAKCAPPLRPAHEQDALWRALTDWQVNIVASDHSPAEPAMKQGDFVSAWGGIAGVQSTLAVLLDRGRHLHDRPRSRTWDPASAAAPDPQDAHRRRLPLERIVDLVATEPARRFGIAGKGSLTPGADADLMLVDLQESYTLAAADLHQRHKTSPYLGATFRGRVCRTIRRGETIFLGGRITAQTTGRMVRPATIERRQRS
jgi:allantoinase